MRSEQHARHLPADVYLDLSCRLETMAQDYCAQAGCSEEQALEALLSAAAHYAVHSQTIHTFDRVTEKLRKGLRRMLRDNPGFFHHQSGDRLRERRREAAARVQLASSSRAAAEVAGAKASSTFTQYA
jgi:hypothetical protein